MISNASLKYFFIIFALNCPKYFNTIDYVGIYIGAHFFYLYLPNYKVSFSIVK